MTTAEHSAEVAVLPVQHPPAVVHTRRFSPTTLPDRLKYANELAMAGLLPKDYRRQPPNVLLAMEYADSLGIPLVQALSTIAVIDGKPSAQASLIAALVRRAGHRLRVSCDGLVAVATIVRFDDPSYTFTSTWDMARAERAGLVRMVDGKPRARSSTGKVLPWEAYPEAMLKARATTEVARDACQEALLGIMYTPEELGAIVNEDGSVADDAPSAGAQRSEPVAVADAKPIVPLPDDFEALVKEVEERHDLETLRELYDRAVQAQDLRARAFAMSAGQRVRKYLEAHPEEVPLPDVADAEAPEAPVAPEAAEQPSAEELDGVSSS